MSKAQEIHHLFRLFGVKRKRIVLPAIQTTKSQEIDLNRLYQKVVSVWEKGQERIVQEYTRSLSVALADGFRDDASTLRLIIETIGDLAVSAIVKFEEDWPKWAWNVERMHLDKIIQSLKYSTNINLSTHLTDQDVAPTVNDMLQYNVGLITNISDQARGRIASIVFRGFQNRTPVDKIAKQISEATGMARDRARRVASDQTVKLGAALDKERQLQLGMDSFEWMHSGKTHFRPEHKARDGKTFKWDSEVGRNDPPGFLPFCGCKAKGVLDLEALLAEEEAERAA